MWPAWCHRQALVRALVERGFADLREIDATLLRYLHHVDGATVTELARLLQVTKQAMSQQVASFVGRGYGIRERSPADGRERVVRLTERGQAARAAAIEFADAVESELTQTVGPAAVRGFRRVLHGFVNPRLADAPEAVRIGATMRCD
jgi:DNA-binding MarR family transcriptional regulator